MATVALSSLASVVEDVLQQHENRTRDLDFEARRAEEAAIRRYEAAEWLRKVVGVVCAKDLPAEPSEEEFRLGLRSGIILCNVLNKIRQGAVQKVVESPCDPELIPDGAALSAYQYFENVRNFLVAVQPMGIPTFEASDFEQGGKSSRIVNCVLALKSFYEWKQSGGNGVWKFGANVATTINTTNTSGKQFVRKNMEPFMNFQRCTTSNEKSLSSVCTDKKDANKAPISSLSKLVHAILSDRKPEEVPNLVESVLSKFIKEFEHQVSGQNELKTTNSRDTNVPHGNESKMKQSFFNVQVEKKDSLIPNNGQPENVIYDTISESTSMKQKMIVDQQKKDIKILKQTLSNTKDSMQLMQMKFNEEINHIGTHIHGLAYAASGFHRVLEENRRLYNQVQDLKGSIRIYCRVRPFLPGQCNYMSTVDHFDEGVITINTSTKNGKGRKSFNFNKVFGPTATQEEVFSDTQQLIRSVLDGYNVCIFAYGQTGSGKTFTMSGPKDLTEKSQGVNYRALSDLFLLAEQRKDTFFYEVFVQMIEIYNEQVRDLLTTDGLTKRLEIRNTSQKGLNVPDASLVRVSSTSDVINLMNIGQRNRAVGSTALNDRSSRSHSCLTVHVQGRDLTTGAILRGCMHLIDLAGSERVDKSEVTGDRLKEAQHINKSLSALGDVISSLAQKNSHVPYRNSKLTQLLQDSLGGQAKTLMFVHVSPEADAIGETISTLKFAERVASVELGAARVNKDSADVKELKEQIASLKAALARRDGESVTAQQKVSGSPCNIQLSPRLNATNLELTASPISLRKPMEEVGNIEVLGNFAMRQKKQSLDLDQLPWNSPPRPPFSNGDDNTEPGSGEWVDKLMVNKQDHPIEVQNPPHPDNANISHVFNQKYLSPANNHFDANTADDLEELELLQFNHSKLGIGQKAEKPHLKQTRSPEIRNMTTKSSNSPSQKAASGGHPRIGRHVSEVKRKTPLRK